MSFMNLAVRCDGMVWVMLVRGWHRRVEPMTREG